MKKIAHESHRKTVSAVELKTFSCVMVLAAQASNIFTHKAQGQQ